MLPIAASLACASGAGAEPVLWNGIEAGTSAETLSERFFEDAHHVYHPLSRHFAMSDFYLEADNPVHVQVDLGRDAKRVCGIDIQGSRTQAERRALLASLGPPDFRSVDDISDGPGGGVMLGGFRVWTWRRGAVVVRLRERLAPGYFLTEYRPVDGRGRVQAC